MAMIKKSVSARPPLPPPACLFVNNLCGDVKLSVVIAGGGWEEAEGEGRQEREEEEEEERTQEASPQQVEAWQAFGRIQRLRGLWQIQRWEKRWQVKIQAQPFRNRSRRWPEERRGGGGLRPSPCHSAPRWTGESPPIIRAPPCRPRRRTAAQITGARSRRRLAAEPSKGDPPELQREAWIPAESSTSTSSSSQGPKTDRGRAGGEAAGDADGRRAPRGAAMEADKEGLGDRRQRGCSGGKLRRQELPGRHPEEHVRDGERRQRHHRGERPPPDLLSSGRRRRPREQRLPAPLITPHCSRILYFMLNFHPPSLSHYHFGCKNHRKKLIWMCADFLYSSSAGRGAWPTIAPPGLYGWSLIDSSRNGLGPLPSCKKNLIFQRKRFSGGEGGGRKRLYGFHYSSGFAAAPSCRSGESEGIPRPWRGHLCL